MLIAPARNIRCLEGIRKRARETRREERESKRREKEKVGERERRGGEVIREAGGRRKHRRRDGCCW